MPPLHAERFSDNSNARLWLEVEWIVTLISNFFAVSSHRISREISQKLHMDFSVIRSICQFMDEQELRGLFTDIGSIMEDASVIALMWMRDETLSIRDRAAELRDAYNKIGALLDNIEANVR